MFPSSSLSLFFWSSSSSSPWSTWWSGGGRAEGGDHRTRPGCWEVAKELGRGGLHLLLLVLLKLPHNHQHHCDLWPELKLCVLMIISFHHPGFLWFWIIKVEASNVTLREELDRFALEDFIFCKIFIFLFAKFVKLAKYAKFASLQIHFKILIPGSDKTLRWKRPIGLTRRRR